MRGGYRNPEIAYLDGSIYDISYDIIDTNPGYSYENDVLLPALRDQSHNRGEIRRLHALLSRIVDPNTSDESAMTLWHQDANLHRFGKVSALRSFVRDVLDVIDAHPELMET